MALLNERIEVAGVFCSHTMMRRFNAYGLVYVPAGSVDGAVAPAALNVPPGSATGAVEPGGRYVPGGETIVAAADDASGGDRFIYLDTSIV